MNLDKAIENRFSCRSFKDKKPNWRKIIQAIDAANKAPLAGNLPLLKYILVDKEKLIQELGQASTQEFVKSVHYIIDDKRGEKYAAEGAGAAVENFLLKITDMGLATCWVGAFSDKTVKRILHLPENVKPVAILPIGYARYKREKQRSKTGIENILYFNKWKNKRMTPISKPEAM